LGTDADSVAEIMQKDKPEAFPTFLLPIRQEIAYTAKPPPHTQTLLLTVMIVY